jgi:NTP pyrophosphatase (non-canonical NTP hydrolase)
MKYYLYHIPGKKVGVTTNLENRVHKQQGYLPDEYDVIAESEDIEFISAVEQTMQKFYKYRVDEVPYNKLNFNKMKINVTEQTTTFPVPVNKLKGRLMDNIGMRWSTEHGECLLTKESIKWIMKNVKESMYNKERCYVYNKAFARWFDNNDPHQTSLYESTVTGALMPTGGTTNKYKQNGYNIYNRPKLQTSYFELIREWAQLRGLYEHGDIKTQALKLVEEVGETCRAVLKDDDHAAIDGIGDCVVVLTNLAELLGVSIEDCIEQAYNEIKDRTGKMDNGTFKKD